MTQKPTIDITSQTDEFFVAEASPSPVSWCAILAGAVVAGATSLALLFLGSSLGFATMSPWSGFDPSIMEVTTAAIIWMIVMQWISSGLGGYLTGRLRTRWTDIHSDEVCFRDTAHGFLTWALATLLTAGFLATTAAAIVGTGTQAASTVAAGEAARGQTSENGVIDYYVDSLYRSDRAASVNGSGTDTRGETTRLMLRSMRGDLSEADESYLAQIVANRTGMTRAEAERRVDTVTAEMKQTVEKARKAASTFSIFTFLSMLIGAFIGSVTAAIGGRQRDDLNAIPAM